MAGEFVLGEIVTKVSAEITPLKERLTEARVIAAQAAKEIDTTFVKMSAGINSSFQKATSALQRGPALNLPETFAGGYTGLGGGSRLNRALDALRTVSGGGSTKPIGLSAADIAAMDAYAESQRRVGDATAYHSERLLTLRNSGRAALVLFGGDLPPGMFRAMSAINIVGNVAASSSSKILGMNVSVLAARTGYLGLAVAATYLIGKTSVLIYNWVAGTAELERQNKAIEEGKKRLRERADARWAAADEALETQRTLEMEIARENAVNYEGKRRVLDLQEMADRRRLMSNINMTKEDRERIGRQLDELYGLKRITLEEERRIEIARKAADVAAAQKKQEDEMSQQYLKDELEKQDALERERVTLEQIRQETEGIVGAEIERTGTIQERVDWLGKEYDARIKAATTYEQREALKAQYRVRRWLIENQLAPEEKAQRGVSVGVGGFESVWQSIQAGVFENNVQKDILTEAKGTNTRLDELKEIIGDRSVTGQ